MTILLCGGFSLFSSWRHLLHKQFDHLHWEHHLKPWSGKTISGSLDDPSWAPLIELNASYTYYPTYAQVLADYNRPSALPTFMVEANYEFEHNAADLGTPRLSDSLAQSKFFDPDRFLTTGGVKYEASPSFSLEPEVGLGYERLGKELGSGYDEVVHKVLARAGGRLNLASTIYFSASAKLPVYTYQLEDRRIGGDLSFMAPVTHNDYDLLRRPGGNLGWSSEAGIRLGGQTELNIFYDQTPFTGFVGGSPYGQTEERFGTRFMFHFK